MGKIILCLFIVLALLCIMPTAQTFALPDSTTYYVYCQSCDIIGEVVDCGNGVIVTTNKTQLYSVVSAAKNLYGVSLVFDNTQTRYSLDDIVSALGVKVVSQDSIGGIYGYCPKLSGGVTVDGKAVNLQIVSRNGKVYIGTPVILGSY